MLFKKNFFKKADILEYHCIKDIKDIYYSLHKNIITIDVTIIILILNY